MEIFIVPLKTTLLERFPNNAVKPGHYGRVNVEICKKPGVENESEKRFFSMLTNSLAKASIRDCKCQKFHHNPDTSLRVYTEYDLETGRSTLLIGDKNGDNNAWFSRLERVCGGVDKFTLDVDIALLSKDENYKLEVRGEQTGVDPNYAGLIYEFDVPLDVIGEWEASQNLIATFSVKVKLSDDAVECIYLDHMVNPFLACKAMLLDSSTSDAILVAANGEQVKCHKAFLSAHSDVFKTMFESELKNANSTTIQLPEMSEPCVRALLSYLYCWEIKEISKSSSIALELLVAADKYNIPKLLGCTRDLFLLKDNEWFTPSVAIRLLQFARNKEDLGEEETYKLIKDKCIAVLKSIPREDLHKCLDYQNLFADPQAGWEFCSYLLHA